MNNLELQQNIEDDLKAIPNIKLSILSAKEAYLPLVYLYLKFMGVLYSILTVNVIFMTCIGRYNPNRLITDYTGCIFLFSVFFLFIGPTINSYVMFGKMVQYKLKTKEFILKKVRDFTYIYIGFYSLLFSVTFFLRCAPYRADPADFGFNGLIPATFFGFIVGGIITSFVINSEMERLGLGAVFNVTTEFFKHKERLKKGLN